MKGNLISNGQRLHDFIVERKSFQFQHIKEEACCCHLVEHLQAGKSNKLPGICNNECNNVTVIELDDSYN